MLKQMALVNESHETNVINTNPESSETGPSIHSPPRSKYLKHPVLRTWSSSPCIEVMNFRLGIKSIALTICTKQVI